MLDVTVTQLAWNVDASVGNDHPQLCMCLYMCVCTCIHVCVCVPVCLCITIYAYTFYILCTHKCILYFVYYIYINNYERLYVYIESDIVVYM